MTLPNVSIGRGPARQGVLGWKHQGVLVELEEEAPRGNPQSRGVRALREQALQREISHMSSQGGGPKGVASWCDLMGVSWCRRVKH